MRIIAGRFGGRLLATPSGAAVRPTADRVREALFNILAHGIDGFAFSSRKQRRRAPASGATWRRWV